VLFAAGTLSYVAAAVTTPLFAAVPVVAVAAGVLPLALTPQLAAVAVPYFLAQHAGACGLHGQRAVLSPAWMSTHLPSLSQYANIPSARPTACKFRHANMCSLVCSRKVSFGILVRAPNAAHPACDEAPGGRRAVVYHCRSRSLLRALWFGSVATHVLWFTYAKAVWNTGLWAAGLKSKGRFKTTIKTGVLTGTPRGAGTPRGFDGALAPDSCAPSADRTPAPGTPTQAHESPAAAAAKPTFERHLLEHRFSAVWAAAAAAREAAPGAPAATRSLPASPRGGAPPPPSPPRSLGGSVSRTSSIAMPELQKQLTGGVRPGWNLELAGGGSAASSQARALDLTPTLAPPPPYPIPYMLRPLPCAMLSPRARGTPPARGAGPRARGARRGPRPADRARSQTQPRGAGGQLRGPGRAQHQLRDAARPVGAAAGAAAVGRRRGRRRLAPRMAGPAVRSRPRRASGPCCSTALPLWSSHPSIRFER